MPAVTASVSPAPASAEDGGYTQAQKIQRLANPTAPRVITLLGGTGSLGWALALQFLEAGWDVRIYARSIIKKLEDPKDIFVSDLIKFRRKNTSTGTLYVACWDALVRPDLMKLNAEAFLGGNDAEQHMKGLLRHATARAEDDEDWFELLKSIYRDEAWARDNFSIKADSMIDEFQVSVSEEGVHVEAASKASRSLADVVEGSDVVMNALGMASPDDCIKSVSMQRLGFTLNATVLYELGNLFADLKTQTILAYCSTNYVFELAGFPNQLAEDGYLKQKAFPVLPEPVGNFRSAGEALANAFGVIDAPDPSDEALRRKTVYPATRFLGEYLLNRAIGREAKLLTFRFPGFYADVGVGGSNTVMAQLEAMPAERRERLQALKTELDALAPDNIGYNAEFVHSLIQNALDKDVVIDAKLRWVLSSVDLANRVYGVIESRVRNGNCEREAVLINGENPNVKSDWMMAGFLAHLAHQGNHAVLSYLTHESQLKEEALWRHVPVSTEEKRLYSPQHMFDDSVYPDWISVPGQVKAMLKEEPEHFFLQRREMGIRQMARNLAGIDAATVPGRKTAFRDASRYKQELAEVFNTAPSGGNERFRRIHSQI